MKRLTFKRTLFVKHSEKDFNDDGTHFRVYYYKDQLPISVASAVDLKFVSIRLDYLGIRYNQYKEDYRIVDMFNGCDEVDMEKFIENCEYLLNKYVLKKEAKVAEKKMSEIRGGQETQAMQYVVTMKDGRQVRLFVDAEEWSTISDFMKMINPDKIDNVCQFSFEDIKVL